ncbi:MAG: 1,2-phenylacetyl-CoA epoxidase subunit PaaE [Burkholderiaceae bacterium]
MPAPRFNPLTIIDVSPETSDAITVLFDVPQLLRTDYRFTQGQFLTLKSEVNGEELRRSYSICTATSDYDQSGELRVAIKRVADGRFSNWANDKLAAGQTIDVMTPDGRFFTALDPACPRSYVGFAGGSGITPMLSIIASTLDTEEDSRFTLVYGNRSSASIMFIEALEGLKNRFLDRFRLIHVLSDEPQDVEIFNGLLDQEKCTELIARLIPASTIDHVFICGPEPMMNGAEAALLGAGLPPEQISIERFGTPNPSGAPRASNVLDDNAPGARVRIIADGKARDLHLPFDGPAILDAGLMKGANLPFACKGGVCCTCRAKVLEGEVSMDKNYTLEQWEIDQGFVLTCQAHPVSESVVVSYDER